MKVTFFFRKKRKNNHSIERVFNAVIQNLPASVNSEITEVPEAGAKPGAILANGLFAKKNTGKINHVTGDVHYLALFLPKSNTILTIHDIESILTGNTIKRFLLKKIWFDWPIKRSKYVTVISETTKSKLQEIVTLRDDKIKVIPNPVVNSFTFRPREELNNTPKLLQIGTKKNKNLSRLILAIKDVSCHLIVVGALSEEHNLMLEKNQISFENHENISDKELKSIYDRADILTFISLFEGFGLPIIEAQLSGIPVITSNISSMPEVAGKGAITVDPTDIAAISQGINKIISDQQLRMNIISMGLTNATKYNVDKVTGMYVDLYNKIYRHDRS